jgi:hypothetical protein
MLYERGNEKQYWGKLTFIRFGLDRLTASDSSTQALPIP